eukprot:s5433_g5.t1
MSQHFDLSHVNLHVGCTLDDVLPFFAEGRWCIPSRLPTDLSLPAVSEIFRHLALHAAEVVDAAAPHYEQLEVFTDGSFDGKRSSWAFLVLGWHSGYVRVVGWSAGPVVTDPSDGLYIGALQHDAPRGEASALFWAFAWLAQGPKHIPVHVWSDCLVVLQQANGHFGFPLEDLLDVWHIRSHRGHPANECVDALAKWACRGAVVPAAAFQCAVAAALRQGQVAWWWLVIESVRCPLAWPRQQGKHFTDGDRFADVAPPTEAESRAWLGLDPVADPSGRSSALTIHLRLMSVNVQTLNSVAKGVPDVGNDDFSGRAAYLREQCEYHGANVVALQETRSRHSETINSQSHIRLCSGRDAQGHHGVELWFARNLAISTCATDPLRVQLSDLLVLHADPRLLIVRLSRRSLHVLFVAVHAPIAADPRRDQWWKDLSTRQPDSP